jgi:hypothetical protein
MVYWRIITKTLLRALPMPGQTKGRGRLPMPKQRKRVPRGSRTLGAPNLRLIFSSLQRMQGPEQSHDANWTLVTCWFQNRMITWEFGAYCAGYYH